MILRVTPSTLSGEVSAPPSKSLSARFIAAALLADSPSMIHGMSESDDTTSALEMAAVLGAEIELGKEAIRISPTPGGIPRPRAKELNAGESGLAARMFAPIAALANTSILLTGKGTLLSRPIEMVTDGLQKLGVSIAEAHTLPLEIEGPLVGGEIHLDGSVSSQFLTGLLLALPYAEKDSKVTVKGITSRPYIDMTLEVLRTFDLDYTHEISEGIDVFHIPSSQTGRGGNFNI
ncbi:MAG: hypothetical protein QMB91_00605, partial [Flavobacteriales bacterium]